MTVNVSAERSRRDQQLDNKKIKKESKKENGNSRSTHHCVINVHRAYAYLLIKSSQPINLEGKEFK